MKLNTLTTSGKKGKLTVSDSIFGVAVNKILLSQAVRVYMFNQRQGTSKVKTRSEVIRTKRKWYKQKGTGNARHGARSAHIFVGGGVAHGPKGIENWKRTLSKQMKRQALITALSAQVENFVVSDALTKLSGKTKSAYALLSKVSSDKDKVLVVLPESLSLVTRSLKNLPNVLFVTAKNLNLLEVVRADKIVTTSEAVKLLEKRLITKEKTVKPKVKKSTPTTAKTKKPTVSKATKKSTKKVAKKSTKKVAKKKTAPRRSNSRGRKKASVKKS